MSSTINLATVVSIVGALVAIQGLTFTIFWRIFESAKKSTHKRIDELKSTCDIQREKLGEKGDREPMYNYMDSTFVRKDVHATEYNIVIEKLEELKKLVENIRKKNT